MFMITNIEEDSEIKKIYINFFFFPGYPNDDKEEIITNQRNI